MKTLSGSTRPKLIAKKVGDMKKVRAGTDVVGIRIFSDIFSGANDLKRREVPGT